MSKCYKVIKIHFELKYGRSLSLSELVYIQQQVTIVCRAAGDSYLDKVRTKFVGMKRAILIERRQNKNDFGGGEEDAKTLTEDSLCDMIRQMMISPGVQS